MYFLSGDTPGPARGLPPPGPPLVRAGDDGFTGSRLAGIEAFALHAALWLIEGDDAQRRLRLLLDRQFRRAVFGPFDAHEAALLGDDLLELVIVVGVVHVLRAEIQRPLE